MIKMNEINKEIIFKWIEAAFNTYIKPHYDDIKKNKDEIAELNKKLDGDIESRKIWEDAWVKVSNSYLKWNDELKSLSEDFLTLASLLKDILNSESEKELPKHENGLNHMHGINSETSVSDSKLPDLCKECGGSRMGERMMHNDWCSQCTTSTTAKKLPETITPDTPTDIQVDWIVDKLRKKGYNIIDDDKKPTNLTVETIFTPILNKPLKSLLKKQYKKQMEQQ